MKLRVKQAHPVAAHNSASASMASAGTGPWALVLGVPSVRILVNVDDGKTFACPCPSRARAMHQGTTQPLRSTAISEFLVGSGAPDQGECESWREVAWAT